MASEDLTTASPPPARLTRWQRLDLFRNPPGGTLHGVLGWPVYGAITALLGVNLYLARGAEQPSEGQLRAMNRWWGRILWAVMPFWRLGIVGRENLRVPSVIVSNHTSSLDIPACYGLGIPLRTCARPGIFHVPVMGPFLNLSGQIRSDYLVEEGRAALARGHSVVVFAEGSRSMDGQLQRLRAGAFHLAREAGVPIVPIAVSGSRQILGAKRYLPTALYCRVRLEVLPAIPHDAAPDAAGLNHLTRRSLLASLHRHPA